MRRENAGSLPGSVNILIYVPVFDFVVTFCMYVCLTCFACLFAALPGAAAAVAAMVAGHQARDQRSGNENIAGGGGMYDGRGRWCRCLRRRRRCWRGERDREPDAPPPALSFVKKIRRDANPMRRQDAPVDGAAAASATAAATVGQENQQYGLRRLVFTPCPWRGSWL